MPRRELFASLAVMLMIAAAGLHSKTTLAEVRGLGDEGWYTWQVRAVEQAPAMCCFSGKDGAANKGQCDLDGHGGSFAGPAESATPGGIIKVYAWMEAGIPRKIRVLSSSCTASAKSTIIDLGSIETADSVQWLERLVSSGRDIGTDAIAAVAVHHGQEASDVLVRTAQPGNHADARENAIFWMGQLRISETASELRDFVFKDESAGIREHAAFSYAQSDATDIADVLIRQGRNDKDPDVRSHAWFWLAQTGANESEEAIRNAVLIDQDKEVREEAVFALSQLPGNRAVKALAAVLEDRQLTLEIREQALFWMAQTESDEAFEYIDRLLSDN